MTDIALVTQQLDLFAEDLPDHEQQLAVYQDMGMERREAFGLEVHAAKITSIRRRSIVDVGRELLEAREKATQRGAWGKFLERVDMEERLAQIYMNVARQFGDRPEIISAFPATALMELSAPNADPEIVGHIIEDAVNGKRFKVREVKARLAEVVVPARPQLAPPAAQSPDLTATPLELAIEEVAPTSASIARPPVLDMTPRQVSPAQPPAAVEIASVDDTLARPAPAAVVPAAQPPTLAIPARPAPAAQPPALTIPAQAAPAAAQPPALAIPAAPAQEPAEIQQLKLLVAKEALLTAALADVQAELQEVARDDLPTFSISPESAAASARTFVDSVAVTATAKLLSFSAVVVP